MEIDSALLALATLATRTDEASVAWGEILSGLRETFRPDSAFISLPNPDTGALEAEASHGFPPGDNLSLERGMGIPGWVAFHGRSTLVSDTAADSRYRAMRPEVRCQTSAPLSGPEGQVMGVITLDRDTAGAYSPSDLAALERFADLAARVIQRHWQVDRLQGKARQLETLLTTGQSLVSQLEPDELFTTLTRNARRMMRARAAALYVYDPAAATVRVAAFDGGNAMDDEGAMPVDSCLVAAAIHTRHSVSFADIQSPEFRGLADLPRDGALRSVLATPVSCEGEVLAVLAVFTDRVHRFDNDEKRLCATLAGLGAVALQNARLYARVFQGEESLRKNERLTTLGLLAAEIAHEIRNPLTVLKLLLGGLGVDFPAGDPRRTDMRVIGEKLDQLEGIVSRVLNFAKAPASLHTRCPLLAEMVEDTLVLMRLKLAQARIQVRFDPPPHPIIVDGHKGQLQQALLNLLINALEAMPDGGAITITLGSQAPSAVLDIADTGAGIPDALRDCIFDSFLSSRPAGTGLGLAIAKRALLSHHGDIRLLATGPGGATFRITLPLAKI